MEINPEHPVTRELHDQWHKFVAILMSKFAPDGKVTITSEDVAKLQSNEKAVLVHAKKDCIELSLVSPEQADRLSKQ